MLWGKFFTYYLSPTPCSLIEIDLYDLSDQKKMFCWPWHSLQESWPIRDAVTKIVNWLAKLHQSENTHFVVQSLSNGRQFDNVSTCTSIVLMWSMKHMQTTLVKHYWMYAETNLCCECMLKPTFAETGQTKENCKWLLSTITGTCLNSNIKTTWCMEL